MLGEFLAIMSAFGFTITILECKFVRIHRGKIKEFSFTITILECKYKTIKEQKTLISSFTITILECKFLKKEL